MGGKAAIILVVGFSFILTYIGLNLNSMSTRTVGNMSRYHDATAAHNLATIGANVGLAKFYADTSWISGSVTQTLNTNTLRGSFTVEMADISVNNLRMRSVSSYAVSDPTSTTRTLYDTVEVYFDKNKLNSFSLYAWMTNIEGNVNWITGDTVWGRVHSNDYLTVNGRPVFMEKVTTSQNFNPRLGRSPNNAILKNGFEAGVARIPFPTDLSDLNQASKFGGRRYTTDIWVTLSAGSGANNDGMAYVRTTQTGPIVDSVLLSDPTFNGVMYGTGRVNVQGTLDGKLSIASLTDLYIQNDVVYEHNPRFSTSDDMLGLIAERNVVVADNAANRINCEIHGSVFTRTGSFTAENYNSGSPRGLLNFLGSIVQERRGAVGTFGSSGLLTGYYKRYRYDERLADPAIRPPFYPGFYLRSYAIANWWESFRIMEFN
ncbi:MAG TPA: hypothetical protein VFG32_10120 [Bacteroidota bacterium]|nr:hypothetical protein [Bacteroidota bacterium]